MTDREKLIDLLKKAKSSMWGQSGLSCELARNSYIAEYLLANGVVISKNETTTQRWIPVTERLPEEPMQTVLVTDGRETCVAVYSVVYDEFAVMCGRGEPFGVTHWMPLPEPPKEE